MAENNKFIEKYFSETAEAVLDLEHADNQTVKTIIDSTIKMMSEVKHGITYTQLRKVYLLFKISNLDFKQLQLIRPKLAYIKARLDKEEGKKLIELIDDFITKINTDVDKSQKQIENLVEFMQSIVAYRKLNA